jgi:hypothetical protein
MPAERYFILRIDSFEGRDTHIHCGDDQRDFLYVVGCLDAKGNAEVLDCGYRSFDEAARAWPEARPLPKGRAKASNTLAKRQRG